MAMRTSFISEADLEKLSLEALLEEVNKNQFGIPALLKYVIPILDEKVKSSSSFSKAEKESLNFLYNKVLVRVARILVETSRQNFNEIPADEFADLISNPLNSYRQKIVDNLNNTTFLIQENILKHDSLTGVWGAVQRWIIVLSEVYTQGDLHTMHAIIGALNQSSIKRLIIKDGDDNLIKGSISKKFIEFLNEINILLDEKRNYGRLRYYAKTDEKPLIPYLGLYFRDFIQHKEQIEKNISDEQKKQKQMFEYKKNLCSDFFN